MGYTLRIGELTVEKYREDGKLVNYENAEEVRHNEAPAYGEPTDNTNSRWPSYTAWHDFARFVDLEDLFYDKKTGLIRNHPGCIPLLKQHKEIIDEAYKNFYKKYPKVKAGYSPKLNDTNGVYEDKNWPEENSYAVRLEWLKYWVDWALENCKNPVFYNS